MGAGSGDALPPVVKHSATHQHSGQEEQGTKVHLDTLYQRLSPGWVCPAPHTHLCTAGGTHPPGHAQQTEPATSALAAPVPSPLLTDTPCLPPVPLLSSRLVQSTQSGSGAQPQGCGAQAQLYLCPCSVSCHCHGAPEPHRSQWRHRWEQQL